METFESYANVIEEDLVKELEEFIKPEAEDKLYDAFIAHSAFGTAGLYTIGVGKLMNAYAAALWQPRDLRITSPLTIKNPSGSCSDFHFKV